MADINILSDADILRSIDEKLLDAKDEIKKAVINFNILLRIRNDLVDSCEALGVDGCASDDRCEINEDHCVPSLAEENIIFDAEEYLRSLGLDPDMMIL